MEKKQTMRRRVLAELGFAFIIFLYVLTLALETGELTRRSRMFPVLILTPTLGLLTAQILMLLARTVRSGSRNVGTDSADASADHREAVEKSEGSYWQVIGWLGAAFVLVYLFGILAGAGIFVFLIDLLYSRASLRRAIGMTAGTTAALYVLFVVVLRIPLFPGIVFRLLEL